MFCRIDDTMAAVKIEQFIRERARELGFGAVGFAEIGPSRSTEAFRKWLINKYCAGMHFLERHAALRSDPRKLAPAARSMVVTGARYPFELSNCAISNFARGTDYHLVLRSKLEQLAGHIAGKCGLENIGPICVDSNPLPEREWAVRAGIGWIGKQGSVVNPEMGCCFFIGTLMLNIELEQSPEVPGRCGDCDLCLKACPAGAILPENQLDARRCVSYMTIEHRGEINPEISASFGNSVFGCDRCTSICPWNRRGKAPFMPEFDIIPAAAFSLENLSLMDKVGFQNMFRNSAVKRVGFERFSRNIKIALDNQRKERNLSPPARILREAL